MFNIRKTSEGIVFKILVQTRSSESSIVGLYGDALKIKLTAPPVDNSANKLCIRVLAKRLGIAKSSLEIIKGHTSRSKQILLRSDKINVTDDEISRLKQLIEKLAS